MQMEEVAVSKCIEYYNVMNSLQTAKSMLQWIMHICEGISLQLTANSFCSEACFYVKNEAKTDTIESLSTPLFIRGSAIFNPSKKSTAINLLQTATAILQFYLFAKCNCTLQSHLLPL